MQGDDEKVAGIRRKCMSFMARPYRFAMTITGLLGGMALGISVGNSLFVFCGSFFIGFIIAILEKYDDLQILVEMREILEEEKGKE